MDEEKSVLRKELEAPSGLSLLVAALDAQDVRQELGRRTHSPGSHSPPSSLSSEGSEWKAPLAKRRSIPDTLKDDAYWEKRRRNNEAAKRSRQKRRLNDMALETRLVQLSTENSLLKSRLGDGDSPGLPRSASEPRPAEPHSAEPRPEAPAGTPSPLVRQLSLPAAPFLPLLSLLPHPAVQAALAAPAPVLGLAAGDGKSTPPFPFADGKQYLRFKLLEKHNKRLEAVGGLHPNTGTALLSSLASPGVVVKTEADSMSLKDCLSSLSIAVTAGHGMNSHGSSDSQSSDSSESPRNDEARRGRREKLGPALARHRYASEDQRYMERRRRNNEAAKRCRANRRAIFEFRFKRAQELERENTELKEEMRGLTEELASLRDLLAKRHKPHPRKPKQPESQPLPADHAEPQ